MIVGTCPVCHERGPYDYEGPTLLFTCHSVAKDYSAATDLETGRKLRAIVDGESRLVGYVFSSLGAQSRLTSGTPANPVHP